jgi:hypothetical protein
MQTPVSFLSPQLSKPKPVIESQDFASCGRIVVRTFLFVSGVGVALKNFHYRIGDPTLLSGGWLGVRQVTFAIFFLYTPLRLAVEERTVA